MAIVSSRSSTRKRTGVCRRPEELIEPFLTRFVGKVQGKAVPPVHRADHPLLKTRFLPRRAAFSIMSSKEGDWAVAEMRRHPLKGDRSFYADLTQYITFADDHFVPGGLRLLSPQHGKKRRTA